MFSLAVFVFCLLPEVFQDSLLDAAVTLVSGVAILGFYAAAFFSIILPVLLLVGIVIVLALRDYFVVRRSVTNDPEVRRKQSIEKYRLPQIPKPPVIIESPEDATARMPLRVLVRKRSMLRRVVADVMGMDEVQRIDDKRQKRASPT